MNVVSLVLAVVGGLAAGKLVNRAVRLTDKQHGQSVGLFVIATGLMIALGFIFNEYVLVGITMTILSLTVRGVFDVKNREREYKKFVKAHSKSMKR